MEGSTSAEQVAIPADIDLTERQEQILGCLACVSNGEEAYATEASRQIVACTELSRSKVLHGLIYLQDRGLVDVRPRTTPPKPGTVGPSQNEHGLTAQGRAFLPDSWKPCDNREARQHPFTNLSKLQTSFMRCISCLTERGMEATAIDIADCTGRTVGTTSTMLDKFVQQNFLNKDPTEHRPRKQGGRQPFQYSPTPLVEPHMPKPPSTLDCRHFNKEAERLYASFTDQQRRALGCVACLWGKTKRGEIAGVQNGLIADCQELPARTVVSSTSRFSELGIVEMESGFNESRNRTLMTPTVLGKKLFTLTTLADTCTSDVSTSGQEIIHLEKTVSKCMGCIWTKQYAKEEKPAASTSMIAQCSGLSLKSVQLVVKRMADTGRIKRTMSPTDDLRGTRMPTVTYSPLTYLRELPPVGGSRCALPIYTDVPDHFVQPLGKSFLKLPPRPKKLRVFDEPWVIKSMAHSTLTAEEEVALGRMIQDRSNPEQSEAALETFIRHNFKLAIWGVSQAKSDLIFLPYEDAILVAQRAISYAAERFDPEMGTKFSTYAAFWLRQKLQRAAADYINVPFRDYLLFPKAYYAVQDFQTQYDRFPSIVELSRDMQLPPNHVDRILQRRHHAVSLMTMRLETYLDDEEEASTFHSVVGQDDPSLARADLIHSLTRLNQYLSPAERDIITNITADAGIPVFNILTAHNLSPGHASGVRNRVTSLLQHPFFGILAALDGSFDWQAEAACSKLNHDPVVSKRQGQIGRQTMRICQACPVSKQCSSYAAKARPALTAGIWGGKRPLSYSAAPTA